MFSRILKASIILDFKIHLEHGDKIVECFKYTYYDNNDVFNRKVYTLYFSDMTSLELNYILNSNIEILSYIIDEEKYYARDINELDKKFYEGKSLGEKIYYEANGYKIDAIKALCSVNDIINLKKKIHIY